MKHTLAIIALLSGALLFGQGGYIGPKGYVGPSGYIGATPGLPGGTFTLVQQHNCTITSGVNSCTFTVSPNLATGNAYGFACLAQDSGTTVPPRISSITNAGGTLVPNVNWNTGNFGNTAANNRQFSDWILPSTSTGGSGNPVITFNETPDFGGWCYMAELHPSANGSNVGIDTDMAFQPSAACTSCVSNNFTQSASGDACLVGQTSTSAATAYPTAITSPYNTNAFFSSSALAAGFSVAITSSGTGPTWTQSSAVPELTTSCIGWNPSAFLSQAFIDFAGGTTGGTPTAVTMGTSTHGWQGAHWNVSQVGAAQFDNTVTMGLLNATGRLGDGSSYAASSGNTMGLSVTGTGSSQSVSWIIYDFGNSASQSQMVLAFKYNDNLGATDTTSNDCGNIHGASDFSAANCYGDSVTRFIRLETPEGNGSNINFPGGSTAGNCPCTIVVAYNAGNGSIAGTHSVSLYNSTGTQIGSSSTHAGSTSADLPQSASVGDGLTSAVTNGKKLQWGSMQLSLNSTVPSM